MKYCLPCCAFYPPFITSLLFVQMPNSLLCETQGFQVNVDPGLVFSVGLQLQSALRQNSTEETAHIFPFFLNTKKYTNFHVFLIVY